MLHITRTQSFLIFVCGALSLPLLAIAGGNHGGQVCHAETAGGIKLWALCSSRRTTCNDDAEQTCTIDGNDGNYRDAEEKSKDELANNMGDGNGDDGTTTSNTIDKTTVKAVLKPSSAVETKTSNDTSQNKATGKRMHKPVSSSAINKLDPDDDGDSIGTGGNKATDHNSSRSNKTSSSKSQLDDPNNEGKENTRAVIHKGKLKKGTIPAKELICKGDGMDNDCDSDVGANHNSTRSNKTKPIAAPDADDSDGDDDTVEIEIDVIDKD